MKKPLFVIIGIIFILIIIFCTYIIFSFIKTSNDIAIFKLDVEYDEIHNYIPTNVKVPIILNGYKMSTPCISFPEYEEGQGNNDKQFYFSEDDLLEPSTNLSISTSTYRSKPGPIKRNDIIEDKEYNLSNGFSIRFYKHIKISEYVDLIEGEDDIEETISIKINVRYKSSYKDIEPADDMVYYKYPNIYNNNEYITFIDHSEMITIEEYLEQYPENLNAFNNASDVEKDNLRTKFDYIYNNYIIYYIIKTDYAIYNIEVSKPCNYDFIKTDLDQIIDSIY